MGLLHTSPYINKTSKTKPYQFSYTGFVIYFLLLLKKIGFIVKNSLPVYTILSVNTLFTHPITA